jgi:ataxia telangiectasia mutated family protein
VAIIQLLDEYLDYDTHFSLWSEYEGEDLDMDDDQWGPLSRIAEGLVDRDARVRFRAATSTAGLFYLPSLPSEKHLPFYLEVMDRQPRQPEYWDSFLSDLLWKLNCSVTSAHVRHATLYHLYEIPLSFPAFNVHLENGLSALSPVIQDLCGGHCLQSPGCEPAASGPAAASMRLRRS